MARDTEAEAARAIYEPGRHMSTEEVHPLESAVAAAGVLAPREVDLRHFRRVVLEHYADHGRDLPWRRTRDPYRILVSEIMLQQTQVSRVLAKYAEFLDLFPDVWTLADSSTGAVLSAWQGLGYNRRGLALQRTARQVVSVYDGVLPRSQKGLRALPGIGPATAGAIAAFAYGQAVPYIETNIRAAFIHHFFPDRLDVSDHEILPLVEATLDQEDPRTWYYALMDYGSWLKRSGSNPSRRSRHHVRQTPYAGSRRQLRAQILRLFLALQEDSAPSATMTAAQATLLLRGWEEGQVDAALSLLADEGFLKNEGGFSLS